MSAPSYNLSALKAALTRAQRSDDQERVLGECARAFAIFEASGVWPDCWQRWERAEDDARYALGLPWEPRA